MKNSVKSLSSGRSFLPLLRPRPLPILFVTGGGYLGYQHYRINSPKEDGAPPTLATPTQVGTPFSLGNFFRRELFSFSLCVALFLSPGFIDRKRLLGLSKTNTSHSPYSSAVIWLCCHVSWEHGHGHAFFIFFFVFFFFFISPLPQQTQTNIQCNT